MSVLDGCLAPGQVLPDEVEGEATQSEIEILSSVLHKGHVVE
jgi:hypothetical protein